MPASQVFLIQNEFPDFSNPAKIGLSSNRLTTTSSSETPSENTTGRIISRHGIRPTAKRQVILPQYLLAAWLLGGCRGLEIILPVVFSLGDPELEVVVKRLLERPIFAGLEKSGNSFWMRKT